MGCLDNDLESCKLLLYIEGQKTSEFSNDGVVSYVLEYSISENISTLREHSDLILQVAPENSLIEYKNLTTIACFGLFKVPGEASADSLFLNIDESIELTECMAEGSIILSDNLYSILEIYSK